MGRANSRKTFQPVMKRPANKSIRNSKLVVLTYRAFIEDLLKQQSGGIERRQDTARHVRFPVVLRLRGDSAPLSTETREGRLPRRELKRKQLRQVPNSFLNRSVTIEDCAMLLQAASLETHGDVCPRKL